MKKKGIIKDLENFELKHRIIFFLLVMFLTIVVIRSLVFIKNFNPSLFGFEFHHFDYGLILLIITILLLLFGKRKYNFYLFLAAISLGLIVDDVWFIRSNILDPGINETLIYNTTLLPAFIIFILVILVIILIHSFFSSKKKSR
jgi:hypothetical protein